MDIMIIFAVQFTMSLIVWGSLACWIFHPWLKKKSPLSESFFAPAAYGNLLSGGLALLLIIHARVILRLLKGLVTLNATQP